MVDHLRWARPNPMVPSGDDPHEVQHPQVMAMAMDLRIKNHATCRFLSDHEHPSLLLCCLLVMRIVENPMENPW